MISRPSYFLSIVTTSLALAACSSSSVNHEDSQHNHGHSHASDHTHEHPVDDNSVVQSGDTLYSSINLSLFDQTAMTQSPEIVSCTLESGARSECAKFVVKYKPDDLEIGPFCPQSLDDEGGIWKWDGDKDGLYRLDGEFFQMLKEQGYNFYDENGDLYITDGAGRPQNTNTCMNMRAEKEVEMTLLIPTQPVKASQPTNLGTVSKVGISLSGVPIFSDAPSVLETGHLPALDTCGGHIDPGGWYHYHGTATDMETVYDTEHVHAECHLNQNSSALFGYAFDGIGIYGSTEENGEVPTDLDACNGHVGYVPNKPEKVYHYHASTDFPNLPKCLTGEVAKNNFSTTAKAGIGAERNGPGNGGPEGAPGQNQAKGGEGMPPGFEEAAETLGVTAEELFEALNNAGGPRADLSQVAEALNISEEELKSALPEPPSKR